MFQELKSIQLSREVILPYVEQGNPQGESLVLVHGFSDSWRMFEQVLAQLPESIHAFALTLRGHGDASRPATGYRVHDFSADLLAFVDALHLENAVIVGDSMGGLIAQRFAIDHPERVSKLVLIGSPATLHGKPRVRELWASTISNLTDPIDPVFVRTFVTSTIVKPVPTDFLENLVQESQKVPAFVWQAVVSGLMMDDSSSELFRIQTPTLILCGDQDKFASQDQQRLVMGISGAQRIFYPGAGHALCVEEPKRVVADLVKFLST